MVTVKSLESLKAALGSARPVLVPTMGYLHEGHMSLVDRAKLEGGPVVLSIFVNPLQFGEGEDLHSYPRDLAGDEAAAEARGVDIVFAPDPDTMYPLGVPQVTVDPGRMADRLCGAFRPGHFRGVLTVVAKLFNLVRPRSAVFGSKDFQQGVLIRQMVQDLNMDVDVMLAPIVREPDGLALSSRNVRIDAAARHDALGLSRALRRAEKLYQSGVSDGASLLAAVRDVVAEHKGLELQYAEIVSSTDLEPVEHPQFGDVVAVAGFCGEVRLIDNVALMEC